MSGNYLCPRCGCQTNRPCDCKDSGPNYEQCVEAAAEGLVESLARFSGGDRADAVRRWKRDTPFALEALRAVLLATGAFAEPGK